jgi:hypothetical protein
LVVFWLLTRRLFDMKNMSSTEAVANAVDYVKESGIGNLDRGERRRALALLDLARSSDPMVIEVRGLLRRVEAIPTSPPRAPMRLLYSLRDTYFALTMKPWFSWILIAVFVAYTAASTARIVDLLVTTVDAANAPGASLESIDDAVNGRRLGFSGWAVLGSSFIVVACNVLGTLALLEHRPRLTAYRWFERGLLVNIFFVQVFDFADLQLAAFGLLAFNLLVFVTLRLMMAAEERSVERAPTVPAAAAATTSWARSEDLT